MPPKTSNARPSGFVAALQDHGITKLGEISDELLRKLYRLQDDNGSLIRAQSTSNGTSTSSTPRPKKIAAIHDFTACSNAWDTPEKVKEALLLEANKSNPKKRKTSPDKDGDDDPVSHLEVGCTKENCKENPRCLNWLGQAKWEAKSAFTKFSKQWGLGDDPDEEACEENTPVGLRNLGATCYANSFLQVWFQNEDFRRAVFQCTLSSTRPIEEQPLFQLQVVFAALQAGRTKAFNPVELANCLKLNAGEQQDAQEFGKLFMDLLDREFKKQADGELSSSMSSQFEGSLMYGTKCLRCNNRSERVENFKEIAIALKNNKTLGELLDKTLESELLEGDNKYRCENCNKLRDAKRFTQLLTLPPVLHFSLLRFVFDYNTEERKKSSATIRFPKSINMGEFVRDSDDHPSEPVWYDLKGALLHKGSSAHHGHYVAHVFDSRYEKWFMFDDETVTEEDIAPPPKKVVPSKPVTKAGGKLKFVPDNAMSSQQKIKDKNFYSPSDNRSQVYRNSKEAIVLDDSEDERKTQQKPKITRTYSSACKKRRVEGSDDEIEQFEDDDKAEIKSKDAYMLVYTRREEGAPPRSSSHGPGRRSTSVPPPPLPQIPIEAQLKLDEIVEVEHAAMEVYKAERSRCRADFDAMREKKRSVYNTWQVTEEDEVAYLVDKQELEKWMDAEIDPAKKSKTKKDSKQSEDEGNDSDCVVVAASRTTASPSKGKGKASTKEPENDSGFTEEPSGTASTSGKGKTKEDSMDLDEDEELPDVGQIAKGVTPQRKSVTPQNSPSKASKPTNGHASTSKQPYVDLEKPNGKSSKSATPHNSPSKAANGHGSTSKQPYIDIVLPNGKASPSKPASNGTDRTGNEADEKGTKMEIDEPAGSSGESKETSSSDKGKGKAGRKSVTALNSSYLNCPHDKVIPTRVKDMKRVSQTGIMALRELGVSITPDYTTQDSLCRICVWAPYGDKAYNLAHRTQTAKFREMDKGHANCRWISTQWLKDWLKDPPQFHDPGSSEDPAPDLEEWKDHTICEHGQLQPDEDSRKLINGRQTSLLQELFPTYNPPHQSDQPCHVCTEDWENRKAERDQMEDIRRAESSNPAFKRLFKGSNGIKGEYVPIYNGEDIIAVPVDWMDTWRRWLKRGSKSVRPSKFQLQRFFCEEHKNLLVDIDFPDDKAQLEYISVKEWEALKSIYGTKGGKEIIVHSIARNVLQSIPKTCKPCRIKSRSQFEQIEVTLVFFLQEDLDKSGNPPKDLKSLSQADDGRSLSPEVGLRRSSRSTRGVAPGSKDAKLAVRRKNPAKMVIKKGETFKDIRLQIQRDHNIPILYQKIWFKDREIEDAAETVESIGITASETLHVLELPSNDEDVDISKLVDVNDDDITEVRSSRKPNGTTKKKANGRAEGFGGTGLLGYTDEMQEPDQTAEQIRETAAENAERQKREEEKEAKEKQKRLQRQAQDEQAAQEAQIAAAVPGTCPQCTFANEPLMANCEMCDTPLQDG